MLQEARDVNCLEGEAVLFVLRHRMKVCAARKAEKEKTGGKGTC